MSKISIIAIVLFLSFGAYGNAKNFKSSLLPNLSFDLPDGFQKNDALVEYELNRLKEVAPQLAQAAQQMGTKMEAYADPNYGDESKNNLFISAKKLNQQTYYEVKDNQMAKQVCAMMTTVTKQLYKAKKDLMTYKCYKMKFPPNTKWSLYQELDHPDYDGRAIYMLYVDNNMNEVSVSVQCEFKNCNRLRLHMANMIKSIKYN